MIGLPPSVAARYRPAGREEILSWSYGRVERMAAPQETDWRALRGTLDDQAIFGPKRDYFCACGKFTPRPELEPLRETMVCDRCGVMYTSSEARRVRFGNLEFPESVPHPLAGSDAMLNVFPILPAAVWESELGCLLTDRYDEIVRGLEAADSAVTGLALERLASVLLPIFLFADGWGLSDARLLAKGLALAPVP